MTKTGLFSIRMRASKKIQRGEGRQPSANAEHDEEHISGAEGLYAKTEISEVTNKYINRALTHSRGAPDRIVITIENLKDNPIAVTALPVMTLKCHSTAKARRFIQEILKRHGISDRAAEIALKLLYSSSSMRGASLIFAGSGRRVGCGGNRGVRASRIGIGRRAAQSLADELNKQGLDNETVKEALVLASKVSACGQVVAEICISDDPDYTTGYVSSREAGYIRIPHIKLKNTRIGGRVFFIRDGSDTDDIINYLEKTPVIIESISPCRGTFSADEIIHRHNL